MEQPKSSFKIVSDKKARMILPNAITLIGVCIGLTSIKFALDGKFSLYSLIGNPAQVNDLGKLINSVCGSIIFSSKAAAKVKVLKTEPNS